MSAHIILTGAPSREQSKTYQTTDEAIRNAIGDNISSTQLEGQGTERKGIYDTQYRRLSSFHRGL
jgi:hypothetical protein